MSKAIIYCQLQHDLPRCFWSSLKKTREHWKGDIFLIAPQREAAYTDLSRYGVTFVSESSLDCDLTKTYEEKTFFNRIHPGWDGFWDNACKRFIYIYLLQKKFNIDEFIHVETDVVPYYDIEAMFHTFGSTYNKKLVFSHHAPFQLSCCTIYCNAVEIMQKFCGCILEYFTRGTGYFAEKYPSQTILNETHFAYTFQQENPELVDLLPTIPSDKYADEFGFLIDPTAWGMWVDGLHRDPGKPFATINHEIGKLILDGKYDVVWLSKVPHIVKCETGNLHILSTLHFNSKTPEKWI